jgi:hypothetical protein
MAKVWLCRSGILGQSCGPEPMDERPLIEYEKLLGLRRENYLCGLSEVSQFEAHSRLEPPGDARVRVVMGEGTSFANPEHVVVIVDAAEASDEFPSGAYRLDISCTEVRNILNKPPF